MGNVPASRVTMEVVVSIIVSTVTKQIRKSVYSKYLYFHNGNNLTNTSYYS